VGYSTSVIKINVPKGIQQSGVLKRTANFRLDNIVFSVGEGTRYFLICAS